MRLLTLAAGLIALTFAAEAFAANVGDAAPAFTGTTAAGDTLSLSDLKGKTVVLEWTNKGCPFVKKFYNNGDMQKLQADATAKDVVWITVQSSAPGKQGHLSAEEATAYIAESGAKPSHYLIDESGEIGKAYGAKTTPHMFVIDGEGTLRYAGAIDSIASADPADVAKADNYVTAALDALATGGTVETTSTKPYGCSVKYNY